MPALPKAHRRWAAALLGVSLLAIGAACQGDGPDAGTDPAAPAGTGEPTDRSAVPVQPGTQDDPDYAHNVILIVGDGMGISHRELVRLTTVGRQGALAMEELTYQGWTRTDPADRERAVTDSAAAASALATGTRTSIGAIAVDLDGHGVPTLLERAAQSGRATGLVTTSRVTDATPAAFGAHVPDRHQEQEIAGQYIQQTGVDLILGGGGRVWGEPGDGDSLLQTAVQAGYQHVTDAEELAAVDGGRLLGLFAPEAMFEVDAQTRQAHYDPAVPLPVMATKALEVLSKDPDGFFLVVEEEAIDAMAHINNADLVIEAGRALDETVALARDFAAEDGQTLIVVIGDHETGGLALESVGPDVDPDADHSAETGPFTVAGTDLAFDVEWTSGGHSAAATPASAEGPGAAGLVTVRAHSDIHDMVLAAMTAQR